MCQKFFAGVTGKAPAPIKLPFSLKDIVVSGSVHVTKSHLTNENTFHSITISDRGEHLKINCQRHFVPRKKHVFKI